MHQFCLVFCRLVSCCDISLHPPSFFRLKYEMLNNLKRFPCLLFSNLNLSLRCTIFLHSPSHSIPPSLYHHHAIHCTENVKIIFYTSNNGLQRFAYICIVAELTLTVLWSASRTHTHRAFFVRSYTKASAAAKHTKYKYT